MTLEEALNGWRWDGADGAALALAFAQSEKAGRGIYFFGTVGSGKTLAANLLAKKRSGLFIDCSAPAKVAALATWRDWAMPGRSIVLDELGRDTIRNDFGNRSDVVAAFVRELYAAWKAGEWTGRLYVTSNMDPGGLVKTYDESIADRILEMCVLCNFSQGRRVAAADAGAAAEVGRPGDRPGHTGTGEVRKYAWSRYAEHGIDVGSTAFRAALHGASRPGFVMDSLRLMRVNLGVLTGDDCEMARAVFYGANSVVMGDYLRDSFVYGLCASPAEREAFFRGLKAYAAAVYRENERAHSAFRHENAHVFDGWRKRLNTNGRASA